MPEATLHIPQIGEGLQEARLVAILKSPGEAIRRDEPIYQMETDKAVMDVESPYAGTLLAWKAEVDDVLAIGAPVAVIETEDEVYAPAEASEDRPLEPVIAAPAAPSASRRRDIPPRTRAYAKEKGLSEADLDAVPAAGSKLMPLDIDAWLAAKPASSSGQGWREEALTGRQRILASRLQRGSQLVVPGTMTVAMNWEPIESLRAEIKAAGDEFSPSAFTLFAFAAARAAGEFPAFRSSLVGEDKIRIHDHVNLGIAVARPGDELALAVVRGADALGWREFAEEMRARIDEAREGRDQADDTVTLSLTNMQSFGIRDAAAVVVPPAIATVFLGEPFFAQDPSSSEPKTARLANLGLTFDHRLINGVGAAHFQNRIRELAEGIRGAIA